MSQAQEPPKPLVGPIHATVIAFPVALFPAALVSDIAYLNTAVIQWTNFSSWLIAGAVAFTAVLVIWAIGSIFLGRFRRSRRFALIHAVLVGIMFLAGLLNAFQHAQDGWLSVGAPGLLLSILCSVLALIVAYPAHSQPTVGRREA